MLNLSPNRVDGEIDKTAYASFLSFKERKGISVLSRLLVVLFFLFIGISFLPWTQNVRAKGYVTTLQLSQRPQTIHSIIPGRIEKWFVREGDFVAKGDTILFLSETKDKYLDPNLLARTRQQIDAKSLAVDSYDEKAKALSGQIVAISQTMQLKLEQAQNYLLQTRLKVESDSMDFEVATKNLEIAEERFGRTEQLYQSGIKSLTDYESSKLKVQEANGKKISTETKLLSSRNALLNAKIELISIKNQYQDKLAKASSDRFATLSGLYDAEATVSKMENEWMNYSVRQGLYYILAPQDGYITKAIKGGIGETVKEGEKVVSIMPANYDLAVELYINPVDLPLMHKGQEVQLMFDGWPAVVFAGWPNSSIGTFRGEVVAIDNFATAEGKFRLMVAPKRNEVKGEWAKQLRVGGGASGMMLLEDVPIWYEIWRQLNAFPPNFYNGESADKLKQKAPLKSVK